jgi:hypothetical protein
MARSRLSRGEKADKALAAAWPGAPPEMVISFRWRVCSQETSKCRDRSRPEVLEGEKRLVRGLSDLADRFQASEGKRIANARRKRDVSNERPIRELGRGSSIPLLPLREQPSRAPAHRTSKPAKL